MKTFSSIFTGGGGADIGAMQAGLKPIWGIEYIPEIANVCHENLGHEVICQSILDVDPATLKSPYWLHMSPPCPNFSVAKADAVETENDLALAYKMVEFVHVMQPAVISVENVYGYRKSESWQILLVGLNANGYAFDFWHLNAANYGVPQTRKRLVLVARNDGRPVIKPSATHIKDPTPRGQLAMFDNHPDQWVSWLDSIDDLVAELPQSQFAPWQLDRLPEHYKSLLISDTEQRIKKPLVEEAPAFTITASHGLHRASVLIMTGNTNRSEGAKEGCGLCIDRPSNTVTAKPAGGMPKAFLVDSNNTSRQLTAVSSAEPSYTVLAGHMRRPSSSPKAFIVDGQPSSNGEKMTVRGDCEPIHTVTATQHKKMHTAFVGRVVAMTPRCLARFQSFPNWYQLPEKKALSCRIIGNAIPPLLMQRAIEAQL